MWGFKLIQSGVGLGLRFVVSVVTLITPQASNSSNNILFLDWGLVCKRVFSVSSLFTALQSGFVSSSIPLLPVTGSWGQKTPLPCCSDKASVLGCTVPESGVFGLLSAPSLSLAIVLDQNIVLLLPQIQRFPQPQGDQCSKQIKPFIPQKRQARVSAALILAAIPLPYLRPVPLASLSQDSKHQPFLCIPAGAHEDEVVNSAAPLG